MPAEFCKAAVIVLRRVKCAAGWTCRSSGDIYPPMQVRCAVFRRLKFSVKSCIMVGGQLTPPSCPRLMHVRASSTADARRGSVFYSADHMRNLSDCSR